MCQHNIPHPGDFYLSTFGEFFGPSELLMIEGHTFFPNLGLPKAEKQKREMSPRSELE
jgi:hypothetical protein